MRKKTIWNILKCVGDICFLKEGRFFRTACIAIHIRSHRISSHSVYKAKWGLTLSTKLSISAFMLNAIVICRTLSHVAFKENIPVHRFLCKRWRNLLTYFLRMLSMINIFQNRLTQLLCLRAIFFPPPQKKQGIIIPCQNRVCHCLR